MTKKIAIRLALFAFLVFASEAWAQNAAPAQKAAEHGPVRRFPCPSSRICAGSTVICRLLLNIAVDSIGRGLAKQ